MASSIEMIRGLLQKKPAERLGSANYQEILESNFLLPIDWNWLVDAKELLKLPIFSKLMDDQKGKKRKQKYTMEEIQKWSPEASPATQQKTHLRLQDLRGISLYKLCNNVFRISMCKLQNISVIPRHFDISERIRITVRL